MIAGGARSLPADALERLRRRAVAAVESGVPQLEVARTFGVSRKAVSTWVRAYHAVGEEAFRPRRRGRRTGEQLALSAAQQAWVVKTVTGSPPDEVGLPCLLWTRRAVAELIRREFAITLSTATISHYLSRWGLVTKANSLPEAVHNDVLWVTWTRPHSLSDSGRLNALLAVTNRGVLLFRMNARPFDREQLADFRERLRVQLARDVRVVVCAWPAEHFELLDRWRADGAESLHSLTEK